MPRDRSAPDVRARSDRPICPTRPTSPAWPSWSRSSGLASLAAITTALLWGTVAAAQDPPGWALCPDAVLEADLAVLREPVPWGGVLTVADLDGDGRVEIVIAVTSPPGLMIATHAGDRIGVPRRLPLEPGDVVGPALTSSFDVDGDGDPDLVVLGHRGGLWLLRNDGGLRFTTTDVFVPQFNDVVISSRLAIERRNGVTRILYPSVYDSTRSIAVTSDLAFGPPSLIQPGQVQWLWLAALDGEEPDDLVGVNPSRLRWSTRLDDDTWGPPQEIALGSLAIDADFVDVDGDGRRDVVVTTASGPAQFLVLRGEPSGGFAPPVPTGGPPDVTEECWTSFADVDGDGRAEAFIVRGGFDREVVAFRNVDGELRPASRRQLPLGGGPSVTADVDGDGGKELVVHGQPPLQNTLFSIDLSPGSSGSIGTLDGLGGSSVARMVDVDGVEDGRPELVGVRDGSLVVSSMRPGGIIEERQVIPLASGPVDVRGLAAAPVTNDRPAEAAVMIAGAIPRVVSLAWTDGVPGLPLETPLDSEADLIRLAALEIDGPRSIVLVRNDLRRSTIIRPGPGGPVVLDEFDHLGDEGDVFRMTVVDLDQDGTDDLLETRFPPGDATLVVRYGNGDGTLSAPERLRTERGDPIRSITVAVTDWDRDGAPDLVVRGSGEETIDVVRHLGDRRYAVDSIPFLIEDDWGGFVPEAVGDLDGDGDLDVVSVLPSGVFRQVDDPRLPLRWTRHAGMFDFSFGSAETGDLDGDGIDDLLVTEIAGDAIALVRGRACGTPCDADLDADGTVDHRDLVLLLARTPALDQLREYPLAGDLDRDGDVDGDDLGRLLAAWGDCPGT